ADISIAVGMYKEGLDFLGEIDLKELALEDRPMYHGLYGRCYGDMAEYSNLPSFSKLYNQYAREYREKAQPEVEEGSFYHRFMVAFNLYEAGQLDRAGEQLLGILAGGLDQRTKPWPIMYWGRSTAERLGSIWPRNIISRRPWPISGSPPRNPWPLSGFPNCCSKKRNSNRPPT